MKKLFIPASDRSEKHLVSVVIPTKNSARYVGRCLESIRNQSYTPIEIIVVDNRSTDKTRDIARRFGASVYSAGPERAAQTNVGISHARGMYIYRVDSDFVVEKDVIAQAVQKCVREKLDGIAVHNISAPGLGFWSDVRNLERETYKNDSLVVGVRFFTQASWEKIGRYDDAIIWDDYDFHNRFVTAGFRWGRIRAKEYHLGEPKNIWDIMKKSFYYGREMVPYMRKHPQRALLQANPVRVSYVRHWRSFIAHPLLTLGFIIMQFVKYSAGMVGFVHRLIKES